MTKTVVEQFLEDPEQLRLYQQERLLLDVTEHMCKIMKEEGVTRSQLAEMLGKSRGRISQILDGERNLTLRTIANVFTAIGKRAVFQTEPIEAQQEHLWWLSSCVEQSSLPADQWDILPTPNKTVVEPVLAG